MYRYTLLHAKGEHAAVDTYKYVMSRHNEQCNETLKCFFRFWTKVYEGTRTGR